LHFVFVFSDAGVSFGDIKVNSDRTQYFVSLTVFSIFPTLISQIRTNADRRGLQTVMAGNKCVLLDKKQLRGYVEKWVIIDILQGIQHYIKVEKLCRWRLF
jgi:hypothetical protein